MRWAGFRKVRGQVRKRLRRRLSELALPDLVAYRAHLEQHAEEWEVLAGLVRVTISRFNRDHEVFAVLERQVLPALARDAQRGADTLRVWSAGCASGEEPYTLAIIWRLELANRFGDLAIRILATDVDEALVARARRGCFTDSSLRELPARHRTAAFTERDGLYCVKDAFKEVVTIARHDVRSEAPGARFELVMCRNLAFTYFDLDSQRATAARLATAVREGGALVLGAHEELPADAAQFEPWSAAHRIYRRRSARRSSIVSASSERLSGR
jgi:chemotaxis protein methyltransferase CheR